MFLNHEEIKSKGLISLAENAAFSNAGYNLKVNYIVDMDGKNIDDDHYKLKPQGMVYVVFKEVIRMPANLVAFAHVKTSLTKRGVMATNIGIIDPTYKGLISTLLINFGKSDFIILKDDPGLRITFAKIKKPSKVLELQANDIGEDPYIKVVQKDIANLDEKFLNLNKIEHDVKKAVYENLFKIGAIFGALALFASSYFQSKNSSEKDLERAIRKYEIGLETQDVKNRLLLEKISRYELSLAQKDSLIEARLSHNTALLHEKDSIMRSKLSTTDRRLEKLADYIDKQIQSTQKK